MLGGFLNAAKGITVPELYLHGREIDSTSRLPRRGVSEVRKGYYFNSAKALR